ncbi:MAG: leucine-rich repeat domain-containing protein [Ruminococcaceae bacterium]|nr:leucine-rich repeat domain-containing protein [Oscillospiraceae bacterium]
MKKYLLIFCIVVAVLFAFLPIISANAASSGTCGSNLTWTLDDEGTLSISGTGAMEDYSSSSPIPWDPLFSNIKSVIISNGVTHIGSYVFSGCRNLINATIPDSVMSIGDFAFNSCSSLINATIPDRVTYIGKYAFRGCSSLTSITIPESVTIIGESAFGFCNSLRIVNYNAINCTFSSISSKGAFNDDTLIEIVNIGENVKRISGPLFLGCSSLKGVYITDIEKWCSINFDSSDSNSYAANPLCYAKNLYLNGELVTDLVIPPNSVTKINNYAFYGCSGLARVTMSDSVTSVGNYAFYGCGLTSIFIPDSVTSIGKSAFKGCRNLINVTIPNKLESIGDSVFYGCSSLTNITIPESVTSIDNSAFYGSGLTSITIPDGVTNIGKSAFKGCSSLINVTIPESVTSIGNSVFDGCSSLKTVNYNAINCELPSNLAYGPFYNKTSIETVNIGEKVESIPSNLFSGCSSLTSITMPATGKVLSNILGEVPASLTKVTIISGDIPNSFASGCSNIARINIGSKVSVIGENSFTGCINLRFLSIEEGVKKISQNAFKNCTSLSEVTIPISVTSIVGADVFPKFTVIYGYHGSAAEEYAENYGYTFKALEAETIHTTSEVARIANNIVIDTTADIDLSDKILHIALYTADGTLADYIIVPTKSSQNNAYVVFKDNSKVSYAKIFIWNSLQAMMPLSDAETIYVKK